MKLKSLITSIAVIAAISLPAAVLAAPAGQIEGGDIYRVRNVTKNTDFTDPTSADKCEVVQFKVRIHNPGPDALTSVNVKATLPAGAATSHSSQVTVTAENANPAVTTDTAGVNLSQSLAIKYVPGSTELLDANNSKLSTLPDTITTSGVTVGTVGVSTEQKRFVQFKAKFDCPETPVCKKDCTTPQPPKETPATPESLPNTGPGDVAAIVAAVTAVSTAAYYTVSRRLSRQ